MMYLVCVVDHDALHFTPANLFSLTPIGHIWELFSRVAITAHKN